MYLLPESLTWHAISLLSKLSKRKENPPFFHEKEKDEAIPKKCPLIRAWDLATYFTFYTWNNCVLIYFGWRSDDTFSVKEKGRKICPTRVIRCYDEEAQVNWRAHRDKTWRLWKSPKTALYGTFLKVAPLAI